MKTLQKKVNLRNFREYIYFKPHQIKFELYDKYELVMLCYALLDEFEFIKSKKYDEYFKNSLDNFR